MRKTGIQLLLGACAVSLPGVALATNGYFAHGYGMKSLGMAGVGIALPQDALAPAANPAGIAFIDTRLDAGLSLFRPVRGAEIVNNEGVPEAGVPSLDGSFDGNGTSLFTLPEFGYNRRISEPLAVGIAVYGNGGMNTNYKPSPFAALGGRNRAGVDLAQLFVAPAAAWKITPQHSIGVALNLAFQQFRARGVEPFGALGLSSDATNLSNTGTDRATGVGVRVGWTGQITSRLTLGATWQSKIDMSEFDEYAGLFADQGDFDIPANMGVGAAIEILPQLTIALDVQRIEYSDVNAVGNPINSLVAGQLLGADNGPGFGWEDINIIKLGANWQYDQNLTLRAGISHADQPVPDSQTFFNILAPGVVQDHLSLGATRRIGNRQELSFAYTRAFEHTVNGNNSIPPNFGGGNANIHLAEDILGIAWAWRF